MKGKDSTLSGAPSTQLTAVEALPSEPPSTSRRVPGPASQLPRVESKPARTVRFDSATLQSPTTDGVSAVADIGDCLSEEMVLAFLEGRVPNSELVRVHSHLDRCQECQELIAGCARAVDPMSDDPLASPASTTFAPGSTLAHRYRIQRFVARGGMGEVYDAYDTVLQGRVALKTVVASASTSERAVRRLKAEVQLAQRVSHPNVCRIFDWGMHEGAGGPALEFLTMQFVEGETLAKRLLDGPIGIAEAISMARQLLSGLEAAHVAEIVHRDFKTHNIMLRPRPSGEPHAYIMDFGLARALDLDPARLTTGRNEALVGTLSYMAPEQVQGRSVSAATDIYAFGVVFFEMLTGRLPFVAESAADAALKRLRERPVAPSTLNDRVPRALDRIVLRCLARDQRERYGSARQVLDGLDQLEGQEDRRTSTSKRLRFGAVAVCTVALGAIVGFGALHRAPPAVLPGGEPAAVAAAVEHVQALNPAPQSRLSGEPAVSHATPSLDARADEPNRALVSQAAPSDSNAREPVKSLPPDPSIHTAMRAAVAPSRNAKNAPSEASASAMLASAPIEGGTGGTAPLFADSTDSADDRVHELRLDDVAIPEYGAHASD